MIVMEKLLEAIYSELLFSTVGHFRDSVGVKNAPVAGLEGNLDRCICGFREEAEEQSVLDEFARLSCCAIHGDEGRMSGACIKDALLFCVYHDIHGGYEVPFEFSAQCI